MDGSIPREDPRRKVDVRYEGFITRLDLQSAFTGLMLYSEAFKERYPLSALEFDVVSVSEVEDDGYQGPRPEHVGWVWPGPSWIEDLPKSAADID